MSHVRNSDPSDGPVEEVESGMGEASGESEVDTSTTDAASECGESLENGGKDMSVGSAVVQTELTFPRHDLACHVANGGDEVVSLGLIGLARASLGATARYQSRVDSILGGNEADLSCKEFAPIGSISAGIVEPQPLDGEALSSCVRHALQCFDFLQAEVNKSVWGKNNDASNMKRFNKQWPGAGNQTFDVGYAKDEFFCIGDAVEGPFGSVIVGYIVPAQTAA